MRALVVIVVQLADFTDGVYLADFEFYPARQHEGNVPTAVCLVVRRWPSGKTWRFWSDELQRMVAAPFPVGERALFVAYYASAELDCSHALGWQAPQNILDLYVEFRCLTNGQRPLGGYGLLGALMQFGLPTITSDNKGSMRELVLAGGPWSVWEQKAILDYCESNVVALDGLLTVMSPDIDLPRGLLRGRYMKAVSCMQSVNPRFYQFML